MRERKAIEVQYLHASLVPVVAEADDDGALLLGEDGLVDGPAGMQMRQQIRHGGGRAER